MTFRRGTLRVPAGWRPFPHRRGTLRVPETRKLELALPVEDALSSAAMAAHAYNHPERHYPARRSLDDHGHRSNIVFCTVCVRDRRPLLATPAAHALLIAAWTRAEAWLVGRYVILPDHLHLFCAPARRDAPNVKDWVAFWKSMATRQWPRETDKPLWQRDVWDRQLRQGESYGRKWDYVRRNPVRHGHVTSPDDWPFQGERHVLMWHDE